ncbi:MAG TPA: deoxyribodipyrimidine photo-lyase [Streptosporangiaceae bacterium]|nr:deoxyribodipyrimidine photo-lyase [Streptosporangiaceae bacterium]
MTTSLAVFTRDLRVHDNPALAAAAAASPTVLPVFVIDDELIARVRSHASRLAFLTDSLADLDRSLRQRGGALVTRRGQWADTVLALARQTAAAAIHLADDYSGYARRRLAELDGRAAANRIRVIRHPSITLAEPGVVVPAGGAAYQVFGPYYQRWQKEPVRPVAAAPGRITLPDGVDHGQLPSLSDLTTSQPAAGRLPGGERAGAGRLRAWASDGLAGFAASRDLLAADSGSRLAPYLHLGCLSARAVAAELAGRPGSEAFLRQLAWRDFFHQVLAARPDAAWRDYRSRGDRWRDDAGALQAWQEGQTGYPVVDAAMRQLAAEGYMPNRARMIVASFLTKDLYLDWRSGAAHFMQHLTDGDVACNQLNWQWVAGTGTDTNPRRIFNPLRQSERFDPDGDYLRRHLPELAGLPADRIHDPDPMTRRACAYPGPIVDHRAAIAEFRARTSRQASR